MRITLAASWAATSTVQGGRIQPQWQVNCWSFIGALHRPLGEIVDIKINWSATDAAPELDSMGNDTMSMPGWRQRHQRLMVINGTRDRVKLLAVPHRPRPPSV